MGMQLPHITSPQHLQNEIARGDIMFPQRHANSPASVLTIENAVAAAAA
jgi:hypothetical protein